MDIHHDCVLVRPISYQSTQCEGKYDITLAGRAVVTITAQCSDGRAGMGQAVAETGLSGRGKINLNNGTGAVLLYGQVATSFLLRVATLTNVTPGLFLLRHRIG